MNCLNRVCKFLLNNTANRLQHELVVKRPVSVNRKRVVLQHDNAGPHAARLTQEKITQMEVLAHLLGIAFLSILIFGRYS